jgi:hypothetical protein
VDKPITNIQVFDDYITFNFMGGGNKSNFHVFLPAYYGCIVTAQSGSTSPVNSGGNFSFKVELLPTHNKSDLVVTANKIPLTASNNIYTISNITEDIIVRIEGLKFNTFPITAIARENGTIVPDGEIQVNEGGMKTFEIKPDNGYSIDYVVVDGENREAINSFTFINVNEPHTISAIFKKGDLYTIIPSKESVFFETRANVPSDTAQITVSSPDIIAYLAINAPNRFQISADKGKNWQQGFSVKPNQLPYTFSIRFAPPWGMGNVGTFNEVLTFKSTDAYAEVQLTGLSHLGINDNKNENEISVYPNPTTGELTVCGERLAVNGIEVFDVYGRSIEIPRFAKNDVIPNGAQQNEESITMNISHLSAGIYMIAIYTENGVIHKKIVKE